MSGITEFGLLGPLLVRSGGADIPIRRGHQRALLALLLLNPNQVAPVEEITEALWGPASPTSAPVAVRSYIRGLRLALGPAGRDRISTAPRGYLIRVGDGELDVARFEDLLASARAAARGESWQQAAEQARQALSWWRGEPLADIESQALALRDAPRLAELRLQAAEIRIDADLRLGGHSEVLAELPGLCAAHPLREHLHGLLMRALYQCGRQAEALAAYQHARNKLVEELGVEPGAELRELHRRILSADPALAVIGRAQPAQAEPQPDTPRQLPSVAPGFTGRAAELKTLTQILDQARTGTPGTVVISAIGGMAGVGKTTLALCWAHHVADRFPGGQLYVNLRGFDPSGTPVSPADAIRGFLDALGVPPERIPPATDAQAGLYRSLVAGRQMLIVLDNARDEHQIRPLLPASPASLVIVTSRNQLAGLAATDGARLVTLDVLVHDEAVQLLTARLGVSRAAEPGTVGEIAALCAHLPLALAVAAARAAARPRFPLAQLAADLRDAVGRLDALDAGDPAVSVAGVFSWSYSQLSKDTARMFRLLGLHPGPDISVPAAASLAAIDEPGARRALRELARDCLITEHAPGRYALHDLLRAYAANQALDTDSENGRDAAIARVLDHYLHTASHGSLLLQPSREPVPLAPPAPGTRPERLADHRHALAWFEAEHHVLLAAVTLAAGTGADRHAWQLPWAMTEYLYRRSCPHERVTVIGTALAAATRLDDALGQAVSLRGLGTTYTYTGDHDQARAHLERSLRLYQRLGDRTGEAMAQQNLAVLAEAHGRYADALGHCEQALRLSRAIGPPAAAEPQRAVPRELPSTVPGFTGRSAELQALTRLLDRPGGRTPKAVVISAIGGTAGVGKTALAVHWAHQVADLFPDGELYVNLRGYDPGQPVAAAEALAGFLLSLGVPGHNIPPEAEQRAARYRSLLAGKRMLVILDNAGSADQVRPLLPGTGACAVLVTSRDALAGLVARDGAARLDLDVLPPQDAVALLETLIGARAAAEPEAAAGLAELCCRLPLALRVAAELAASRPDVPLAGLTEELADLRTRLDLLNAGGDPRTQVRAVFSWSCRHLGAEDARAFRLLGLHPRPDLDPYAAAALTGATVPQARRALDVLARAHLISPAAPGRYGMHDLLRGYARELSAAVDGGQEQHAALTRLFDHYLHTAATAIDTLYPAERRHRPRIPRPATPVPPLPDPAAARDWLNHERAALVAAVAHTAAHGWPSHTTRLSATLTNYLRHGGHIPEALTVFNYALGAARRTSDRAAEATALNDTGLVDCMQGRFQQAADHYQQALALFRETGDRAGEARTLANMGLNEMALDRYEHATRHEQDAIAICRDTGDRFIEARALGNLGRALQLQSRYQEAISYNQQTLDLCREIGDREGEGYALARLGVIDLQLGRYQHAAGYLQQALALFNEMDNPAGEAEILPKLGEVHLGLGRYRQAAGNFEQALAISRKIGYRAVEAYALNGLGDALCRTGETGKARAHHAAALRLASKAGSPQQQAHAHSGLARAYHADADSLQARHHWQEALTRYTAIGAPEADEIRAQLAMASDSGNDGHKPTEKDEPAPG